MTSKVIIVSVELRSERAKKISSKNWVHVFHSSLSKNWLLDFQERFREKKEKKRPSFFLFKIEKEQFLEHSNRM